MKIVQMLALTLLVAGCGTMNDNNDRNNLGLNTQNEDNSKLKVNQVNYPLRKDGNPRNVSNTNDNNDNFNVSEDMANRVAGLKEVKSATVITTDRNAYVAAVMNNDEGKDISNKVENKIADTVRSVDSSIDNVYVSTNPDFVDRINQYVDDVQKGRPVKGFGNEFGELVNRVFPNSR